MEGFPSIFTLKRLNFGEEVEFQDKIWTIDEIDDLRAGSHKSMYNLFRILSEANKNIAVVRHMRGNREEDIENEEEEEEEDKKNNSPYQSLLRDLKSSRMYQRNVPYLEMELSSGIYVGYAYKDLHTNGDQIVIRDPTGKRIGLVHTKFEVQPSWFSTLFGPRFVTREIIDFSDDQAKFHKLQSSNSRVLYRKMAWQHDNKNQCNHVISNWFFGKISMTSTSSEKNASINPSILVFMYSFDALEQQKARSQLVRNIGNFLIYPFLGLYKLLQNVLSINQKKE